MSEPPAPAKSLFHRHPALYVCAGLVAAVLALYAHVFQCEFIDFDDGCHVTANPCVVTGLHLPSIAWAFTHDIAAQWIPLTWISHMVDVSLFGLDPGPHHLGNVLLHALNTCLVFAVLRRLTGEFWPSVAVAALFAVHPINVESVAWIAERKNVLSTLFWLLAMWAYTHHVAQPRGRWMWATAAFMALGLLAKPMLVTLPCALLLLDFWPLQRAPGIGWWRLLYEKAVLFLLSAVSCATTLAAAAGVKVLTSSASLGLQARLANAVIGYAAYLGNLFWPAHLAVLYPIEAQYSPAQVLAAVALLLGVTVLCLVFRRRSPFLLIGWLWFLGILVPVSSVFQVGSQAYADRFAYIPQLGIFWGVVWAVRSLTRGVGRWLPVTAAAAVLALLASLTVRQVNYWSDTVTLFTHNLAVTPGNAVAESILGMGWVRRGDYAQAIVHYREAKRLMPHVGELRTLLGEALAHTGRNAEAIEELRAAVAFDPTDAPARRKLVVLLVDQGRLTEAHQFLPH